MGPVEGREGGRGRKILEKGHYRDGPAGWSTKAFTADATRQGFPVTGGVFRLPDFA